MPNIDYNNLLHTAMSYLWTLPNMHYILSNLPKNIHLIFAVNIPGVACFDAEENAIMINYKLINTSTPEAMLDFIVSLAHELCHANQKKCGLYFDDLKDASFGDTFRIAKMLELETRLLDAINEHELLKHPEFAGCTPSEYCLFYKALLEHSNGDVQKAKHDFVLSYWTNSVFKSKNREYMNVFKDDISHHYFFYTEQSYHQALEIHKFNRQSAQVKVASQVVKDFLNRMGINSIDATWFLKNGYDNAETTQNIHDGITIFNQDGDKYCNYSPTIDKYWDLVTYFVNDTPIKMFLKHGITKEQNEITSAVQNIIKFEQAIKNRNMETIRQIVFQDPGIIDRQLITNDSFPLLMAIQNNYPEAVNFILQKNPNLLLSTQDGHTVLTELPKLTSKILQSKITYLFTKQMHTKMTEAQKEK